MSGALEGIRVLDLSRLLPGGFCSGLLADFGADVLKVEDTGLGDYVRWAPPRYEGAEESAGGALFLALNRNKRSIRIDLKSDAGREVLLRLVRESDVLLEGFRPGVMERLGVGYERLREENPRLVYCAITGYGQDGPYRDRSGHDMNYLGLVGLLGLTGEQGGPPVQSAGQIADLGGGALMAAVGILVALREREVSGEGQLVDVSMADGALSWLAMVAARMLAEDVPPARGGLELAGGLVCYRPYACADGHVTLGALEPKFWQAFCRGVGREDLIEHHLDPAGSETQREVEAIFAARTRDEWAAFAGEHDCCLEPVLGLDEALDSELVRAREMVVEIDQPGAERPVRLLGVPIKLSRTPGDPARAPGPALGQDTRAVLERLGYARGGDRAAAGRGSRGRAGGRLGPRLVHGMKVLVPDDFPRGGCPTTSSSPPREPNSPSQPPRRWPSSWLTCRTSGSCRSSPPGSTGSSRTCRTASRSATPATRARPPWRSGWSPRSSTTWAASPAATPRSAGSRASWTASAW